MIWPSFHCRCPLLLPSPLKPSNDTSLFYPSNLLCMLWQASQSSLEYLFVIVYMQAWMPLTEWFFFSFSHDLCEKLGFLYCVIVSSSFPLQHWTQFLVIFLFVCFFLYLRIIALQCSVGSATQLCESAVSIYIYIPSLEPPPTNSCMLIFNVHLADRLWAPKGSELSVLCICRMQTCILCSSI